VTSTNTYASLMYNSANMGYASPSITCNELKKQLQWLCVQRAQHAHHQPAGHPLGCQHHAEPGTGHAADQHCRGWRAGLSLQGMGNNWLGSNWTTNNGVYTYSSVAANSKYIMPVLPPPMLLYHPIRNGNPVFSSYLQQEY